MKKKLLYALSVIAVASVFIVGCGNMSWGMGNFEYNKVHVDMPNGATCLEVEEWFESSSGVEVKTKEVGSIFLSEGTYIMLEGACPFCDAEK